MKVIWSLFFILCFSFFAKADTGNVVDWAQKDAKKYHHYQLMVMDHQSLSTYSKYSLSFHQGKNSKLAPGDVLYLEIPQGYWDYRLDGIIIGHYQEAQEQKGSEWYFDRQPGLTSVQVYGEGGADHNKGWYFWGGHSSGKWGAKFAEISHQSFEFDNLHEWSLVGYCSVDKETECKKKWHDPLTGIKYVKLVNVGSDVIRVGKIVVKFLPTVSDVYEEFGVEGNPNDFGDPLTLLGRQLNYLGWGESGRINNLYLTGKSEESTQRIQSDQVPKDWIFYTNKIEIPLKSGYLLNSVDILCGDSATGHHSSGNSKFSIYLKRGEKELETLVEKENVSPNGVISGSTKGDFLIQDGDKLVLRNYFNITYLRGVRIGYLKDSH